jgi:hypothetical protein
MATAQPTKVPKAMEPVFQNLVAMTDQFCRDHLNQEYADLARQAIAALCRKRPSPLLSGSPAVWACAVLHALGQVNFLTDRSSQPCMASGDLSRLFGVASSTAGNKAKLVRSLLEIRQFDHRWTLPSRLASSPAVWFISVNGLVVDARTLPVDVQAEAVEKGLIPFVVG